MRHTVTLALALCTMAAPVSAESTAPTDLASVKDACWTSATSWETYETCVSSASVTTFGPGTWLVGTEIPAGTYRSAGLTWDGWACSISRLAGFGNKDGELLQYESTWDPAPIIVTVEATDLAVQTGDCEPWELIDLPSPDRQAAAGP